jgi:hypothetical protein
MTRPVTGARPRRSRHRRRSISRRFPQSAPPGHCRARAAVPAGSRERSPHWFARQTHQASTFSKALSGIRPRSASAVAALELNLGKVEAASRPARVAPRQGTRRPGRPRWQLPPLAASARRAGRVRAGRIEAITVSPATTGSPAWSVMRFNVPGHGSGDREDFADAARSLFLDSDLEAAPFDRPRFLPRAAWATAPRPRLQPPQVRRRIQMMRRSMATPEFSRRRSCRAGRCGDAPRAPTEWRRGSRRCSSRRRRPG